MHTYMDFISLLLLGAGAFNWMAGSYPFFGIPMEVRKEPFWVACRWFGLGYFISDSNRFESLVTNNTEFGIFVSVVFFFGCLRRRITKENSSASIVSDENIQSNELKPHQNVE